MVESERELGLIGTFPVSVSRAAYRGGGKGNGFFVFGRGQAVAVRAVHDLPPALEIGEGIAERGGSHAAQFAKLLGG